MFFFGGGGGRCALLQQFQGIFPNNLVNFPSYTRIYETFLGLYTLQSTETVEYKKSLKRSKTFSFFIIFYYTNVPFHHQCGKTKFHTLLIRIVPLHISEKICNSTQPISLQKELLYVMFSYTMLSLYYYVASFFYEYMFLVRDWCSKVLLSKEKLKNSFYAIFR